MVYFPTEHPIPIQDPFIYNGTQLALKDIPNLSGHPEIHTCYLNTNDIQTILTTRLPPNLQELSLCNNSIKAQGLPPIWLPTLKIILLDRNQIQATSQVVEWPPSLEVLSMDDNPLQHVPHSLPTTLDLLSVSYCKLKSLPTSELPPTLKRIRAYYNAIETLGQLPQELTYLHLGHNLLQSSALLKTILPPTLKFLNLDYNQLTSLPEIFPETLETLSVIGNRLEALPTNLPKSLKMLIANENCIRVFKPSWKPGQRLFQIHLRDNQLTENLLGLKEQGLTEDIFQAKNWNLEVHHIHARTIQRLFVKYKFRKAIRAWSRLGRMEKELLELSYAPEIVVKCHDIDSIRFGFWKR
jgi:Leucine-rich repeat (LRR) protein